MTREEILEKAKVGGMVIIRAPIVDVNTVPECEKSGLLVRLPTTGPIWISDEVIYQIEPPPETLEQQLADALAEIERLKAENERQWNCLQDAAGSVLEGIKMFPIVADPNPWRDHDGGDMPCDGETMVNYVLRYGFEGSALAKRLRWIHKSDYHQFGIIRWRRASK